MLSALRNFFSAPDIQQRAYEAYGLIVQQARNPVFYQQWKVDDSLDGRFDCIVVHVFLVLKRCEGETGSADTQAFMRYLAEAFFADMDRSLREMGVTDTGVGIRVKKMAQAFYGRKKAYEDALGDETALAEALRRNVYREQEVAAECPASLAAYMGRNHKQLQQQPLDAILQGRIQFSS
jgi:cytochrome b pre-mRNA-processing protein 3